MAKFWFKNTAMEKFLTFKAVKMVINLALWQQIDETHWEEYSSLNCWL